MTRASLVLAAVAALLPAPARAQRFLPDDPLLRDRDDLHVPRPADIELATAYDVIENTFLRGHRDGRTAPPAQNVNTLGEVPDSSWWTNRIGVRAMSLDELARGPNQGAGPDVQGAWTVIRGKSSGITPGFTIRDARGDVYFIKVDPARHFGLATGAEVVGSRFFHAFGYSVPETWIAYLRRDQLRVADGARVRVRGAKPRKMEAADLDRMLADAARLPDGRIRFVAGKAVPGDVIGPHRYYGTRPDDPNDVIPHEDRRELRGYRVFCAWLNHDDSRGSNSLDSYVTEGGRGYVKHYLQDFSSILGSGSDWRRTIAPQNPRAGNEYVLELGPLFKTAATLGLWERPWYHTRYTIHPEVGAIEAQTFDPERWKPEYPNAAFESLREEDGFWAARIVARFGDEAIRAIVKEGDFRAPEAEAHLVRTIIARRDKVLARYLGALNPLADFRVQTTGGATELTFANEGEKAGLGAVEAYEYQWFRFDNPSDTTTPLGEPARTERRALPLPAERPEYLMVRIRTLSSRGESWRKRVDVFLRTGGESRVVGVDREG